MQGGVKKRLSQWGGRVGRPEGDLVGSWGSWRGDLGGAVEDLKRALGRSWGKSLGGAQSDPGAFLGVGQISWKFMKCTKT